MGSCRRASRRIDTISGHFGAVLLNDDNTITTTTTKFNPSNCGSNVNTTFRRLDNRLLYGRQRSASQGYFMRQSGNYVQSDVSDKSYINEKKPTVSPTPPLFSRVGSGEPLFARPEPENDFLPKMLSALQCPGFERTIEQPSEKNLKSQTPVVPSETDGKEWSPRINVAESKCSYVIAVELPGIDIKDIRVEMDEKNLIVRGKRSENWWKPTGGSIDSGVTYHKREISPGQYQVVWPLPDGANKETMSAEVMEGILQIAIPKL